MPPLSDMTARDRTMGRLSLSFTLLVLSGFAAALQASQQPIDAHKLLAKMAEAVRELNYEGTFVYLHDNQLESMYIVHTRDGGQEHERLTSLNGAAREVVRDDKSITCIMPDSGSVSIDDRPPPDRFPRILPVGLDKLDEQYRFHFLGEARVAGRQANAIGIVPQDQLRYGYRIYIDQETALPLKSDLMDESAKPIEQIMFTWLRVSPDIEIGKLDVPAQRQHKEQNQLSPLKPSMQKSQRWTFRNLPPGFVLRVYHSWSAPSGNDVEHFVLSDGLASVSVYVEQAGSEDALRGASQMGAINAWGNEIRGHQVTVVGEVPGTTVRKVADSVHYLAAEQ